MATSQNLEDMKLPELKELAKQMGLRGTSTMRKPALLATIQAARSGGEAPAGVSVRAPKTAKKTADAAAPVSKPEALSDAPAAPIAESAPAPAATAEPAAPTAPVSKPEIPAAPTAPVVPAAPAPVPAAPVSAPSPTRVVPSNNEPLAPAPAPNPLLETPMVRRPRRKSLDLDLDLPSADSRPRRADRPAGRPSKSDAKPTGDLFDMLGIDENSARAGRKDRTEKSDEPIQLPRRRRRPEAAPRENEHGNVRDLDDILANLPSRNADSQQDGDDFPRRNRRDRSNGHDDRRDRGVNRRNGNRRDDFDRDDRPERVDRRDDYQQQEELVPVAGIVDVLDSYAFVRTSGYLPGPNDVYISMGQVKKYGLRKGDAVHGAIRAVRDDRRNQRQKFVPLQSIDSINGMSVEEAQNRPQFAKLTPLYPQERLKQETTPNKLIGRIMDIVAPIGKGQRGLIVSPPKAGKTITLQNIANSITTNNPEVHLMVVLVDERPEEVTDMERTVQGEVISSTFDRPASDHTTVAELAIERAKRLVELGQDVVVLLDSMTRLARAYNIAAPASGRILSGGVDAQALYPPKKFFGAARNIENGGSLTIISSALVETGSKMDEVIFEEFKGTGNMELRLSRDLADKRLFPAIDINASGTRREELITPPNELAVIYGLRRALGGMEPEQAYQTLVPRLKKTATNRDFLAAITSTIPQNK
ncbi:transcription termination factor Rho [Bifidobacterium vespertilionis]|uniref:transcription termination factor Rho n=1 Tax=Bifidobacterium vespertilionis TaxID=2562524 RepID=UPI001BDD839A|nr:transcription termination factor Rho [Bifidobacterium vespertilionis]